MCASVQPLATRRPSWPAMILVMALGAFFFLHDLAGKSLWGDEINMIHFVTGERDMALSSGNALGYFQIIEWAMAIGKSENILRLPAVGFAILGLPVIMLLASLLFGPRVGLGTGLLTAVAPTYVVHAQQVHSYSAFCAVASLSLLLMWQAYHEGDRRWWIGWAVSIGLGMWLHLYTVFLVAAQLVILLVLAFLDRRLRRPTGRECGVALLLMLVPVVVSLPLVLDWIAPLGFELIAKVRGEAPSSQQLKMPPAFKLEAATFVRALRQLTLWHAPFPRLHAWILGLAGLGVVVGFWRHRAATITSLLWMLLPVPPIALFAYSSGIDFGTRRLIFALPLLLAFAALGIDTLASGLHRLVPSTWRPRLALRYLSIGLVGVLAMLIAGSALHHFYAFQEHADRRAVARFLELAQRPGDRLMVWRVNLLSYYYRGSLPLEEARGTGRIDSEIAGDPESRRLWYVRPIFAGQNFTHLIPIEEWLDERDALHLPLGGGMMVSMVELDPEIDRAERLHHAQLLVALKPERPYSHAALSAQLAEHTSDTRGPVREARRARMARYHALVPWLR